MYFCMGTRMHCKLSAFHTQSNISSGCAIGDSVEQTNKGRPRRSVPSGRSLRPFPTHPRAGPCGMGAKILPQPSYMNPVSRTDSPTDATAPPRKQHTSDLSLCMSLCSLFDFNKDGLITQEDWQAGMSTLMMGDLANDPRMWNKLVEMHGKRDGGHTMVEQERLADVVPIDPRVAVLLNAIVKGLVGLKDFVERSARKEKKAVELNSNRAILNVRKRILLPVITAWKEWVASNKKIFNRLTITIFRC